MDLSKKAQTGRYSKKNKKIRITSADKWFSIFIRIRDIVSGEYCMCITCRKLIHWKYQAHCGHFATRGKLMTRYDERNCHAQCAKCNIDNDGEQAKHGLAIDRLYGHGTAQKLIDLSEIRGQKEHTREAIKLFSREYREKARELAKIKGIEI